MEKAIRRLLAILLAFALALGCAFAEVDGADIDAEALNAEGEDALIAGNYEAALEKFTPAAEAGYAGAQYNLGMMYFSGLGTEKDVELGLEWVTKAAEAGLPGAQNNLGLFYFNGDGVEKDVAQAVEWFTKSAEQGYPDAQYNLGMMYTNGDGVEKNEVLAEEWLTKAAEQGYPGAEEALSNLSAAFSDDAASDGGEAADSEEASESGGESGEEVPRNLAVLRDSETKTIKLLQTILNALGYDCGTADGIAGKKTQAAVTQYQEDKGLTVTGTFTAETAESLFAVIGIRVSPAEN